MIVFPIAKINLGLNITAKRGDGYHDIETVFYPVPLCDALEFVVSDDKGGRDIFVTTGINTGGDPEDNLVLKTLRKLREKYTIPNLRIHLHKAIPAGAGLGGGSSDSACFLRGLNRFFNLGISMSELNKISLEIGSDCPFFIEGVPAHATGRGEILNPVDTVLSGYYIVLLNPGVGINTREAYQNCIPHNPAESLAQLIQKPVTTWRGSVVNDFESFAFRKFTVIQKIKDELYNSGAIFSLMSGSGSTVYGIFKEKPKLREELHKYIIFEGKLFQHYQNRPF
jgi:4-diphosphocytidyl-2-C-methyl-D-erythritol kinase